MTPLKTILPIFILIASISCSAQINLKETPIGLINKVSYHDTQFDNPNASNGFLVEHNNTTYAITAKHILMLAKTDKMQFVDFANELKEWRMQPKDDSTVYVVMDELLNPNQQDSLTWSYLESNWDTYNDWLVFSIKENNTKYQPLQFRKTPLQKDEQLNIIGWSYSDTEGPQRVYEYTFSETEGIYHNILQVSGPKSIGGLSGSPVIDANGKVVGLVTSGWTDEATGEVTIQATSMDGAMKFISERN